VKTKQIKKMKLMYPGEITDSNGTKAVWTADDLRQVAKNYAFAGVEKAAPVLLSHEVKEKPRYGWVEKAWVESDDNGNDALFCSAQVSEKLFEYSKNGYFPNRSISVFPKSKKINHLALLGAEMPAFENLGLAEFSENKEPTANYAISAQYSIWVENGDIAEAIHREIKELEERVDDKIDELEKLVENISEISGTDDEQDSKTDSSDSAEFSKQKAVLANIKSEIAVLEKIKEENKKEQAANFTKGLIEAGKIFPVIRESVENQYLLELGKGGESLANFCKSWDNTPAMLSKGLPGEMGGKSRVNTAADIKERALCFQKEQAEKGIAVDFKTAVGAVKNN
jgi:hypothetical protein